MDKDSDREANARSHAEIEKPDSTESGFFVRQTFLPAHVLFNCLAI